MYTLHVVATCATQQSLQEPNVLLQALQQADMGRGWLEHARIHLSHGGARGVLFLSGPAPYQVQQYGRELFRRALSREPELATWALSECSLLPMA